MEQKPKRPRTKAETNRAIKVYLDRQCGRIAYSQLRGIGLAPAAVDRRRRSGELIVDGRAKLPRGRAARERQLERLRARGKSQNLELRRRVYRAPGAERSPDGKRWSAVLSAPGAAGLLDHLSACQALGVDDRGAPRLHVVTQGGGWTGPVGVEEHRSRSIPAEDRTAVRGIPTLILPRALLTAAVDIGAERLHDILDTAVRLERYDGDAMVRVLEARASVPGYAPLVAAVAALDATSGTFLSIFERRTTRLVERSTVIPPPVVNVLLDGFRPDLWWVGTRAIVECDGRDYHRSPAQIIADDHRQQILESLGYRFLRLRWADVVYDEDRTLARIERFVSENLAAPVPGR